MQATHDGSTTRPIHPRQGRQHVYDEEHAHPGVNSQEEEQLDCLSLHQGASSSGNSGNLPEPTGTNVADMRRKIQLGPTRRSWLRWYYFSRGAYGNTCDALTMRSTSTSEGKLELS
jgi:hypothetical protein